MTPLFQTIVDPKRGDCLRACVASLLDYELLQVPHFILHSNWYNTFYYYMYSQGYEFEYQTSQLENLGAEHFIRDHTICIVPSRMFPGGRHAVIMDANGIVVHDPNPNNSWLGASVLTEMGTVKPIDGWYMFKRV